MPTSKIFLKLFGVALSYAMLSSVVAAADFDQSHAIFDGVLKQYVKNARVDYAALKTHPEGLNHYLEELVKVPPAAFSRWSETERLACLINLYNAATLKLILEHYPLQSIRRIGFLPGAAWRELTVRFGGQIMTLGHLENDIIRLKYAEPRIHFALVCAAKSCPPLRAEAYTGIRLRAQLNDQARQFLSEPTKNRFEADTHTLYLSPIFKWYDEDFTKPAGSLAAYVKPFLPEAQRVALADSAKLKVRFTDYDWALNDVARP